MANACNTDRRIVPEAFRWFCHVRTNHRSQQPVEAKSLVVTLTRLCERAENFVRSIESTILPLR